MADSNEPARELSDKQLYETVGKITEKAAPEIKQGVNVFLDNVLKKGMTPKEALGLKDETLEGLYGQAYHLFNNGRYGDASTLFRLLIILNSLEPKYSMGLAACLHMQKDYRAAICVYTICGILDLENPLPYYHAYDCAMKLNDTEEAAKHLRSAIERAGNSTQYATLKDRCVMALKSLQGDASAKQTKKK